MKKVRCYVALLVGLGVFALCGSAQALMFTVSDITFANLTGNGESLQWSVAPVAVVPFSFNLEPGSAKYQFNYGVLSVTSFPDIKDDDDSFDIDFNISPTGSTSQVSGLGDLEGTVSGGEKISAIFKNQNWINVLFDTDGLFRVRFLGFNNKDYSVSSPSFDLMAEIEYLREPTDNGGVPMAVVPEPSTVILLGSGLLGLIYVGRSKRRK